MNRVFQALKALPLIRFALMLGGGGTMTALVAWIVNTLSRDTWPLSVAADRVVALKWVALGALGIIAVVMIALAWGKADKVRLSVAGNEVELNFDDGAGEGAGA